MTNPRPIRLAAALAGAVALAVPASAHAARPSPRRRPSARHRAGLEPEAPTSRRPARGRGTRSTPCGRRTSPEDADLIQAMVDQPSAVWFEGGTPEDIRKDVKTTMRRAAAQKHSIPVLVSYNLPYRDCSQYSAGGASSMDEYIAWIDGFAAGLGRGPAVIILEPDSLGIIPWYNRRGPTSSGASPRVARTSRCRALRPAEPCHRRPDPAPPAEQGLPRRDPQRLARGR